jgi:hypothetical protein
MDGEDTKMTCELHNLLYSWIGGAGDGGFFGYDMLAYISSVLSHAAGLFSLIFAASASTEIAVDFVGGQSGQIHSSMVEGASPIWSYTGSGPAFLLGAGADLDISHIAVAAGSGLAFRLDVGATLSGSPQLGSTRIACATLATGIGSSALDCTEDANLITLAGPTFVSTSGTALPLGSVKYIGDILLDFIDAIYTHDVGIYTLDVDTDLSIATNIPIQASMHVSISGNMGKPTLTYVGQEGTFVQVSSAGFLALADLVIMATGIEVYADGSLSLEGVELRLSSIFRIGGLATVKDSSMYCNNIDVAGTFSVTDTAGDINLFKSVVTLGKQAKWHADHVVIDGIDGSGTLDGDLPGTLFFDPSATTRVAWRILGDDATMSKEDGESTIMGDWKLPFGVFLVQSGPCTVSEGGACVGRQDYSFPEHCDIVAITGGNITTRSWDEVYIDSMQTDYGYRHIFNGRNVLDRITISSQVWDRPYIDGQGNEADGPRHYPLEPGDAISWDTNSNAGTWDENTGFSGPDRIRHHDYVEAHGTQWTLCFE